jgi:hypothetical protein
MAGTDDERLHALVDEWTVDAVPDIIDQALEQALIAATERQRRWQLNRPLPGRRRAATGSGDARLDPRTTRSWC